MLKPRAGSLSHVKTMSSENESQVSSTCEHDEFHEEREGSIAIDGLQRQNLEFSHSYHHLMRKFVEKHKTVEPCLCTCRQCQGISSRRNGDLTPEQLARDYDRLQEDYDYLQMKYKISEQYLRDENARLTEKLITTMIALRSCKLETAHQAQCPK